MFGRDGSTVAQDHRALEDVSELPDIARPRVALEVTQRVGRKREHRGSDAGVRRGEKADTQIGEVFSARAQRRDADGHAVEAKVEVRAKRTRLDFERQVPVRCADESNAHDPAAGRADAPHLSVFEDTKQLRLKGERKVSDFVEEHRSTVGRFEKPLLGGLCSRESAAFMAKELGLKKTLRKGRTIDAHERASASRRCRVDCGCRDFFAYTRLAEQKNRHLRGRDQMGEMPHTIHRTGPRRRGLRLLVRAWLHDEDRSAKLNRLSQGDRHFGVRRHCDAPHTRAIRTAEVAHNERGARDKLHMPTRDRRMQNLHVALVTAPNDETRAGFERTRHASPLPEDEEPRPRRGRHPNVRLGPILRENGAGHLQAKGSRKAGLQGARAKPCPRGATRVVNMVVLLFAMVARSWSSGAWLLATAVLVGGVSAPCGAFGAEQSEVTECYDAHETGQVQRKTGEFRSARRSFSICGRTSCPAIVQRDCIAWAKELQDTQPSVVLAVVKGDGTDALGAKALLDGSPAPLDGRAIELDPGEHRIRVEGGAEGPVEHRFTVREGERLRRISVMVSRTPQGAASLPTATYVFGGVAVLSLASFGAFAWMGKSKENDLAHTCSDRCSDADVNDVRSSYLVADVSLGIAAIAAGAAIATWLLTPRARQARAAAPGSWFTF